MTRFFIVLGTLFCFSISATENSRTPASFMPEDSLHTIDKTKKEQKKKSNKNNSKNSTEKQTQASSAEDDYKPSLTESLNDSNSLKKKMKRQLSSDRLETDSTENITEEETANFGNVSVSISERKKEEKLRKVNQNN